MMVIKNQFDIGQTVYLKTDEEQKPRIVVSIIVNKYDLIYELNSGPNISRHNDFEISEEKNLQIA